MTDDDDVPAPAGGEAEARAKLLEEQEARIAALRTAVLSGRVPDEASFDYERFFGGPAKGDAPKG
ncbi:hypothetical protein D3273_23275 [Lichenibacterium minor]|jgi:hypothetical protein|uniref:Uncharacterized protein n=1 Tax=Lichenibacterium minor TaxID=2316528 RepID=A0A4Q2U3U8_9HYPH|nr:type II toxin-antitoxin system ParD family antitoxin [Lichenibacterium minor]RYC29567.1 hypothetical protein D3273_23275 [Lichenibacterium minor]